MRAAGIDQINARQPIFASDLLRAQMFFHRQRVIGAALHCGIVGDDHAGRAADRADTGDEARRRHRYTVDRVRGKRRQFQKRRISIEQAGDAFAWQHFAA